MVKLHKLLLCLMVLLVPNCCLNKVQRKPDDIVKQTQVDPANLLRVLPHNFVVNDISDPLHPKIAIIGEINGDTGSLFIQSVLQDTINGAKDLTIDITSPGGQVDVGFQMASAMKLSGLPSHCVAHEAASMAFFLLQTCTDRAITSDGVVMVHEAHISVDGANRYELRNYADQLDEIANAMAEVEAGRMHMKVSELNARIADKDWFADAKTALKYHMVDRIIP